MAKFQTEAALRFNDETHLERHLNYLFRTDQKQKWTNEYTEKNELFSMNTYGEIEKHSFGSLHERKRIRDIFVEYFSNIPVERLRMVRMECREDVYDFTDEMYEDMLKTMADVNNIFAVPLIVTHVDQRNEYCHYHAIIYVG